MLVTSLLVTIGLLIVAFSAQLIVPKLPGFREVFDHTARYARATFSATNLPLPCEFKNFDQTLETRSLVSYLRAAFLQQGIEATTLSLFRIGTLYAMVKLLLLFSIAAHPKVITLLPDLITFPYSDLLLVALYVSQLYSLILEWERQKLSAPLASLSE